MHGRLSGGGIHFGVLTNHASKQQLVCHRQCDRYLAVRTGGLLMVLLAVTTASTDATKKDANLRKDRTDDESECVFIDPVCPV